VRMALRDQREYVEKIYFCLSRWPEMLSVDEKIIDRITEAVYSILNGKAPVPLDLPSGYPDNEISNHAHRTWYEEAPSKGAKKPFLLLECFDKNTVGPSPTFFGGSFAYPIQMPRPPFSKFSIMEVFGEMFIGERPSRC